LFVLNLLFFNWPLGCWRIRLKLRFEFTWIVFKGRGPR
jgi:hypothetical protein